MLNDQPPIATSPPDQPAPVEVNVAIDQPPVHVEPRNPFESLPIQGIYAESRPPASKRNILAILAGMFVILMVLCVWGLSRPVVLPMGSFFLAAVMPSVELPSAIPLEVKSKRSLTMPTLFGVAVQQDRLIPFFISPTLTSDFKMDVPGQAEMGEVMTRWALWKLIFQARSTGSYLRADMRPLGVGPNEAIFEGPFDGHIWQTNITLPSEGERQATSYPFLPDIFVELERFPEAWPWIQQAFVQNGFELPQIPPSRFVSGASTSTNAWMWMEFPQDLPTSTKQAFAAQAGVASETIYPLLDGGVTFEYRWPDERVVQGTLDRSTSSSRTLVQNRLLALIPATSSTNGLLMDCADLPPIFYLKSPEAWRGWIDHLTVVNNKGKAWICVAF